MDSKWKNNLKDALACMLILINLTQMDHNSFPRITYTIQPFFTFGLLCLLFTFHSLLDSQLFWIIYFFILNKSHFGKSLPERLINDFTSNTGIYYPVESEAICNYINIKSVLKAGIPNKIPREAIVLYIPSEGLCQVSIPS